MIVICEDHQQPMPNEDMAVVMREVAFVRRRRTIVDHVNLTIARGQKWVLFGPNGVGKSTLVRMMATREHPTRGIVDILGHRLGHSNVFAFRPRIGLSSAELLRAFPDNEDPLDAVVTALHAVTGRWRDTYTTDEYDRARALMSEFGVAYVAGSRMGLLSEGERTRIMMCRALMAQPDLLILDEPVSGLDLGGRERVLRAVERVVCADPNSTVVMVTHRLEDIAPGFSHIAVMGPEPSDDAAQRSAGTIWYAGPIEQGLTGEHLSALFGMPLAVSHAHGRWSAYTS